MAAHDFPGSEDYDEGCSPVRDLTLLEQIEYWQARARVAEEALFAECDEFVGAVLEELDGEIAANDRDPADWWKDATNFVEG